jgi:hypothetical protein
MSFYATRAVVVKSLGLEPFGDSIGIEDAHRKAIELGCKAVTPIVGGQESSNNEYSFLVGPAGNFLSRGGREVEHEAFVAWISENTSREKGTVRFAEVEFHLDFEEIRVVSSSLDPLQATSEHS